MKICPACKESNHDAAEGCIMCGAPLPQLPAQRSPSGEDPSAEVLMPRGPQAPASGTLALALYHDLEPRIVAWFPIDTDMTLIGREDANSGIFPDVDLARVDRGDVQAERVSREHARLLRSARGLVLEVLPGSTGTQVNRSIAKEGSSTVIVPGDRVILGGRVRMKLVQL